MLVVRAQDPPVLYDGCGVVAFPLIFVRMPDDESDAAHLARQPLERGVAVAIETSA